MVPWQLWNRLRARALFYGQSNIDQRIGNLKTKLTKRHSRRHAIAGERAP
jgi:hypothetical protein